MGTQDTQGKGNVTSKDTQDTQYKSDGEGEKRDMSVGTDCGVYLVCQCVGTRVQTTPLVPPIMFGKICSTRMNM